MGIVPYLAALVAASFLGGCAVGPAKPPPVYTPSLSQEAQDLHDYCRSRIEAGTNHTTIIGGGTHGGHYDSEDILVAMMEKRPFRFLTSKEFEAMTLRTARESGVDPRDIVTTTNGNATRTTVIVRKITPNLAYAHVVATGGIDCGTWIVEEKRKPLW